MSVDATVGTLFDSLQERLGLQWAGNARADRRNIVAPDATDGHTHLVGHLNLIHPSRIQILGVTEIHYLDQTSEPLRRDILSQLFSGSTSLIVIGEGQKVPADIKQRAEATATPVCTSLQPTAELLNHLKYYLDNLFAEKITLHGVFMEVLSLGVLITGEPSAGKSELALELVARGHRLVADDAPVFSRTAPEMLGGHCPEVLRDFLEVRGLGILNIRAMYGDSAIKYNRNLRLILHLEAMSMKEMQQIDRIHGAHSTRSILGVDVPQITLPVAPGRNLAVLAEAAARNHVLHLKGFDSAKLFMDRQKRFMENGVS